MAQKRPREPTETAYCEEYGDFWDYGAYPPASKRARTYQWVRKGYGTEVDRQLCAKTAEIQRLKEQIREREENQKQRAKEKAMEELKGRIRSEEDKLKRKKAAVEQAQINEQLEAKRKQERKRKIRNTFAQAFNVKADSERTTKPQSVPVANAADVSRMLQARSDYECLQVVAGESAASIKKKYKELAVLFHPDKCKLQGAKAAFQRLHLAYNNLNRIAR